VRTWVIKPEFRRDDWPDDLMCIEIPGEYDDENLLVYIQHDGTWDVDSRCNGLPTAHMFDEFTR